MKKYIILFIALFSTTCAFAQSAEEKLSTEDKYIKVLEEKNTELESEKETLVTKISKLESKNEALQTRNSELESEKKTLETEKKRLESEIKPLAKEIQGLKDANGQLIKYKGYEEENEKLKKENGALQMRIADHENVINAYKKKEEQFAKEKEQFEVAKETFNNSKKELEVSIEKNKRKKEEMDVFVMNVITSSLDTPCRDATIGKLIEYSKDIDSDSIKEANKKFFDILSIYSETEDSIFVYSKQCIINCQEQSDYLLKYKGINSYIDKIESLRYMKDYYKDDFYYSLYLNGLKPEKEIIAYNNSIGKEKVKKMEELLKALQGIVERINEKH